MVETFLIIVAFFVLLMGAIFDIAQLLNNMEDNK